MPAESRRTRRSALRNRRPAPPVDRWPLQPRRCHAARSERRPDDIVDPRDAAESAGLVYVSDEEPASAPQESGQGLHLSQARTGPRSRTRRPSTGSNRSPFRPPIRMCGSARRRTATSRRPAATPRAASSTATTRPSARSARARNTSTCSNSPGRCRRIRDNRRAHGPARPAAREGARHRGAPSREHADPRRQRRLRQAEQELRPHHPARPAREGRRAPSCASSSRARAARPGSFRSRTAASPGS